MTIIQFIRDWLGIPSGYDDIIIIICCVFALLIFDNILRAIFGIFSSLWKRK